MKPKITHPNGNNIWGVYHGPSKVLSNTTFNITETIDVSSWGEGNYSMACRLRDIQKRKVKEIKILDKKHLKQQ